MAQLGDKHLQATTIEQRVVAPQRHKDVVRFHHLVDVLSQHPQQLGLTVRQLLHMTLPRQLLGDRIETIVSDVHPSILTPSDFRCCSLFVEMLPLGQATHARHEFLQAERLLKIVVTTHLKAINHIVDRRAGREEEHRCQLVVLTDVPHHLEAIHPRHHHVGDKHVGLLGEERTKPLLTIGGKSHAHACRLHRVLHNHGQRSLILYQ